MWCWLGGWLGGLCCQPPAGFVVSLRLHGAAALSACPNRLHTVHTLHEPLCSVLFCNTGMFATSAGRLEHLFISGSGLMWHALAGVVPADAVMEALAAMPSLKKLVSCAEGLRSWGGRAGRQAGRQAAGTHLGRMSISARAVAPPQQCRTPALPCNHLGCKRSGRRCLQGRWHSTPPVGPAPDANR